MSGASLKLKSLYNNLSKTERNLTDFILANIERMPFLSVYEMAEAAHVSVATVSRLVRKVGYGNLKNFKVEIARDTASPNNYFYQQIKPSDSEDTLIDKVFLGNIKSLQDTLKILNKKDLIKASKKISQSRRLIFLGIGSSGFISSDAAMRFSMLGFSAHAFTDPNDIFFQVSIVDKNDVVIGLSHSGRTMITVEALRLAKKNKAETIGISNYLKSPLHNHSSLFFCTSFPESYVKVTALTSRIAQLCVIDVLYLLSTRYKKELLDYETINSQLEQLLRLPERK